MGRTVYIWNDSNSQWAWRETVLLQSTLSGKGYSTDKVNLCAIVWKNCHLLQYKLHEEVDSEHRQVHLTLTVTPNNTRKITGVGGICDASDSMGI